MNLKYKFIVSGSGSLELKEKIHESLAGRKRFFELYTVSFPEFVHYKTDYKYINNLNKYLASDQISTTTLLNEYLNYGGYPRVILEKELAEKNKIIQEIYNSYLERDIVALLRVNKKHEFAKLVQVLASQIGNLVNISEISSLLGISNQTINHYLYYLEKTFILKLIRPFFTQTRKELSKMPITYFNDLGLRNYILNFFGIINTNLNQQGFLFENFIYRLLIEICQKENLKLHFWRTKDQSEVDFVINYMHKIIGIEVKHTAMKKEKITRSSRNFIEKYQPEKFIIVNLSLGKIIHIKKTKIYFIPFYKLDKIIKLIV